MLMHRSVCMSVHMLTCVPIQSEWAGVRPWDRGDVLHLAADTLETFLEVWQTVLQTCVDMCV